MIKYFLIYGKRLVRGESSTSRFFLAEKAFEYKNGDWVEIHRNVINDRLMGFDPSEEGP